MNTTTRIYFDFAHIRKTDQVVECDTLLTAPHVFKEAIICNQQQGAGILLVIMSLSLLSMVVNYKEEAGRVRER